MKFDLGQAIDRKNNVGEIEIENSIIDQDRKFQMTKSA